MSQYGNYKCKEFEEYCKQKAEQKRTAQLVGGGILAFLIILVLIMSGCKQILPVIQKEEVVTRYVDSTIWHNDTSYFEIPVEIYRDYTGLLDTLKLENKYSIAWSAVDTNNMILLGELKSKNIKVPVEYKWKERIIYQDSIVESVKEIPVPVERIIEKIKYPWWSWICLTWTLITIVSIGYGLYKKFWKPT